jgi:hypothetical protein
MGEQGRLKAEAEFDERIVVERVMETYRDAAKRKGRMDLYQALVAPQGGDTGRGVSNDG